MALEAGRLTSEQQAVAELVTAMATDLTGQEGVALEKAASALNAQGLLRVGVGEDQGGGGGDLATAVLCWAALATRWPALALTSVHVHGSALLAAGNAADAAELDRLPRVVLAAPVGRDLRVTAGGADGWRLNGEIVRLDTATPDPLVLLCLPAPDCDGVFVVDCAEPGLELERVAVTGLRGGQTFSLRAPAGGVPVRSRPVAAGQVDRAVAVLRLGTAATCVGVASAALDAARRYTSERIQFGAPLAAIPAVDAQLEAMSVRLQRGIRSVLSLAGDGDRVNSTRARRALRACVDDTAAVTSSAIQLHGGYGYLTEYPVEQLYRDAISLRAVAHSLGVVS